MRLRGSLDTEVLRSAVADVIARHEVLRTVYPDTEDGPVQVVLPTAQALPDLAPVPVSENEIVDRLTDVLGAGFDVTAPTPPVRARLFRVADDEHVLALVAHHISADGYSMRPLVRDVMVAYAARAEAQMPGWAELPVQYADYTLWQQRVLGSPDDPDSELSRQLGYWTDELTGSPELLALPTDRPRPARQSTEGDSVTFTIGEALAQRIEKTAREHNATVFMVVHAALAVLLSRLASAEDVAVGTPTAGRAEEVLDDLVGMFVNTLVLRTRVAGGDTFADLLAQAKEKDLAAFGNADVPFERLVDAVGRRRSSSYTPLFQVMLTFQNIETGTLELPGLAVTPLEVGAHQAKFDLQCTFVEQFAPGGGLGGLEVIFTYATALFDRETVELFAERFTRILEAVTSDPQIRLRAIDILTEAERARLAAPRKPRTVADLPDLVAAAAEAAPRRGGAQPRGPGRHLRGVRAEAGRDGHRDGRGADRGGARACGVEHPHPRRPARAGCRRVRRTGPIRARRGRRDHRWGGSDLGASFAVGPTGIIEHRLSSDPVGTGCHGVGRSAHDSARHTEVSEDEVDG